MNYNDIEIELLRSKPFNVGDSVIKKRFKEIQPLILTVESINELNGMCVCSSYCDDLDNFNLESMRIDSLCHFRLRVLTREYRTPAQINRNRIK